MKRADAEQILLDACADVVIRLKDYGSYGGEAGALTALRRRVPGHPPERYRTVLRLLGDVHDRAVEAIGQHRIRRSDKRSRFAEVEDIDTAACLAELDELAPGFAVPQKRVILMRVIYWHYLR